MKNYTATYNTSILTGVQYSFRAENYAAAHQFCKYKFTDEALRTLTLTEDTAAVRSIRIRPRESKNVWAWSNKLGFLNMDMIATLAPYDVSDPSSRMVFIVESEDNPQMEWGKIVSAWIEVEDAVII